MFRYFIIVIAAFLLPLAAEAQQTDDATRDLWDTAFRQKRPVSKKPIKRTLAVRYKAVGSRPSTSSDDASNSSAVVGVTIWRLRPSKNTDDAEVRQLIHEQGDWTPERVNAGSPLMEGSRVQLTIEFPRAGYLYVFDR